MFSKVAKNRAFDGNLNNLDMIGYYFGNASSMTNAPTNSGYLAIIAFGFVQLAFEYSSTGVKRTFVREYENTSWYPWKVLTGVNSKSVSINSNSTYTFTLGQYGCAKIWFFGYAPDEIGLYIVRNNNGNIIIEEINSASKLQITASGSNVSIKNTMPYAIAAEIESVASAGSYGEVTFN
jgi:hypothetical protein